MPRLYFDNAATSFPKPPEVMAAMTRYASELGASPGRGAYHEAKQSGELLQQCRQRINRLIHGESPEHIVFTLNASDALNMAIRGVVHGKHGAKGTPHVITTWLEHNSVLRPLNELANRGEIEQTRVGCDGTTGLVDPKDIQNAITANTVLIAVVHGSNVTGTLQPIARIGEIANAHNIPLLIDAAQTLGHIPLDVQALGIDLLAFPGHKGLLGPSGTGALYIRPGLEKRMATSREGGTGSISDRDTQPTFMPDRFEPGSHNAIGIVGLSQGAQWVLDQGIDKLWHHQRDLIRTMTQRFSQDMPGLTLYGPQDIDHRVGVFSIRIDGFDNPQSLSDVLENDFGLLTRSGIHCAPLAHQTIGTSDLGGTTRLSFGPFTTQEDVRYTCDCLAKVCQDQAARVASC